METVMVFQAVKQNMSSMLEYANIEFREYKKSGNVIFLQQAGEKLFNALENYIQYFYQIQSNSFQGVHNVIREKPLRVLLYDAKRLHQFFYNGELEFSRDFAEDEFIRISSLLEQRVKRLK